VCSSSIGILTASLNLPLRFSHPREYAAPRIPILKQAKAEHARLNRVIPFALGRFAVRQSDT